MGIFRRTPEVAVHEQPGPVHQTFEPTALPAEVRDFSEFLDENNEAISVWSQSWHRVTAIVNDHLHNPERQAEYKALIDERLDYHQETIQMRDGSELRSRSRRFAVKDAFKKDLPLQITRGVMGAKLLANTETAAAYEAYERNLDSTFDFDLFSREELESGISASRSVARNVETELTPYVATAARKESEISQQLQTYLNESYENLAGFMDWIVDAPVAGGTEESPLLQLLAKRLSEDKLDELINPALERYGEFINKDIEREFLSDILDVTNPDQRLADWVRFAAGANDPVAYMLGRIHDWPVELRAELEKIRSRRLDLMVESIEQGLAHYRRRIHQPVTMDELRRIDQLIYSTQDVNESKKASRKSGATNAPKASEFTSHIDIKEPAANKEHRSVVFVRGAEGFEIIHNGEAKKHIEDMIDKFIRDVNGSARMAEDIHNMIDHVVAEPIGHGKVKYAEHKLRVVGRPQPLRLRRINPAKTPGLSIAEETKPARVIYAFDNKGQNGKSAVVIEGIYAHGRGYENRI